MERDLKKKRIVQKERMARMGSWKMSGEAPLGGIWMRKAVRRG